MKITRDKALAVTAFCRAHRITYVAEGQYPNTTKAGLKTGIRSPSGMLIHLPRDSRDNRGAVWSNNRAYIIWCGESLADIEEACAFILMTHQRRTNLFLVRCSEASQATIKVEGNYHGNEQAVDVDGAAGE